MKITLGEQAQERKKHNNRPQSGDIRFSQSPDEGDRLTRALKRAEAADLKKREQEKEQRPAPGEIRQAESGISAEQATKERVEKFLRLAKERFKLAAEAENHWRAEALDDLEFRVGEQWPKDLQTSRDLDGRPCLTMNRLPATIRQVTNEQRQQRPATQVNPVGDGADQDTAEILQGIIRHIEVSSDAEIAYDSAFEHMVTCGFADWRYITEVVDGESNRQEIKIKRIKNPFSVYWDPAATEPDLSDARYCFIIEDVPRSEYDERYSDTEAASLADFSSIGDNAADWATKDTIRVAEYFHVKGEGQERAVYWAKINAVEIMEGNEAKDAGREWPGKWIPVVPVLGDDLDVNGKRHLAGLVRHAKDPQRMYNFWISAATELIALAPKAPFVGAEGQFEGHEAAWRDANNRSFAYLEYKPVGSGGTLAPEPKRQTFEPPVQSINMMTHQADIDLKSVTGLFDPSLGQNKSDQSGRAIQSLQKQGDISTLNFADNLSRAMRHGGRILVDLIQKIYDVTQVQRIINPDQSVDHVIVHSGNPDEAQALMTEKIKRIFDIGVGTYDVTVTQGPSFQTKRQEAVAGQIALVQAYPNAFPVIGDMLVANMDWPQAKEMSERLKKMLDPKLLDDKSDDPEQKVLLLQAQMQQISQQHEQLAQALNQANQVIQTKQVENQGKLQIAQMQEAMRAETVKMQEATKLAVAQINASKDAAQSYADRELQQYQILHDSAHDVAIQAQEHAHATNLADKQAESAKELAKAKPKPTNGKPQ